MNKSPFVIKTILMFLLLSISACGGGGGGDGASNTPPTASAGTDQTIESGTTTATLTGSGTDSDGTIRSFNWTESTGSINITDSTSATATFTAPTVSTNTTLVFILTVTDNDGATATDNITVTVTAPTTPVNLASTLDSSNWTLVNRSPIIKKIVFTGSKYIAVGYSGYIASSTDGISWTVFDVGSTVNFGDVAVAPNGTNAIAINPYEQDGTPGAYVAATTDGTNWQIFNGFENTDCAEISSISHDGTQFVGIFDSNTICTSADGSSWTLQSTYNDFDFKDIVFGSGKYVVTLTSGDLITIDSLSSTATNSPALPSTSSGVINNLQFSNSIFVGIRSGEIIYSANGTDWTAVPSSSIPEDMQSISYSPSKGFIAISKGGGVPILYSSTDSIIWTLLNSNNAPVLGGGTSGSIVSGTNEVLLFTSYAIYRSVDQTTWNNTTAVHPRIGQLSSYYYFKRNNTLLLSHSRLYRSADNGSSWSVITSPISIRGKITAVGARLFSADSAYNSGISYSDDDGVSWNRAITFNSFNTLSASVKLGSTTYTFTDNGQSAQRKPVLSSDDDISFQIDNGLFSLDVIQSNSLGNVQQAVNSNSVIVGITNNTIVRYDGSSWTAPEKSLSALKDLVFNGTNFIVVGANGLIMTSANGSIWTTQTWLNTTATITDVLVVDADLYATDSSGKIAKSSNNGVSWLLSKDLQASNVPVNNVVTELAYDGNKIIGFGTNASSAPVSLVTSINNGTSWNVSTSTTSLSSNEGAASHVFYDTNNSRFVSYSGFESTDGINWSAVRQYPNDASFGYIETQKNIADLRYGTVRFTPGTNGTADTYISGSAAFSNDGLNWVIKTDQPLLTADYTPASGIFAKIDRLSTANVITSSDDITYTPATLTGLVAGVGGLSFIKYVNDQYVGIAWNPGTGKTSFYTSANGSDWSLTTEANINNAGGNVMDIEYDGNQYLILLYEGDNGSGLSRGTMIIKTADLQTLSLFETGLRMFLIDLYVDESGYTLLGNEASIVNRAFY